MILQESSYMSSSKSVYSNTRNSEGVLGHLENILLDKTEKNTLEALKHKRSTYTSNVPTDVRYRSKVSSNDAAIESEFLEEWVVDLHKIQSRPLDDFFSKQKFEGIVLEVKENSFVARLRNFTENIPDEEAEFSITELSKDDISLLKIGAVFYWNIGYLVQVAGQRIGCHMINFRRLPVWTSQEIMAADDRAEDLLSWLESEQV